VKKFRHKGQRNERLGIEIYYRLWWRALPAPEGDPRPRLQAKILRFVFIRFVVSKFTPVFNGTIRHDRIKFVTLIKIWRRRIVFSSR